MYSSLSFDNTIKGIGGACAWAENVPYFKETPVTFFKPGLNVIFGQNGSGKSTLLEILAYRMAAVQGGVSTITEEWLSNLLPRWMCDIQPRRDGTTVDTSKKRLPSTGNFHVVHDGQPVLFVDPRKTIGLRSGQFDYSFLAKGVDNIFSKGSTGETTLRRMNTVQNLLMQEYDPSLFYEQGKDPVSALINRSKKKPTREAINKAYEKLKKNIRAEFPVDIECQVRRESLNSTWKTFLDIAENDLLKGLRPRGQQTIILDEPEAGLSPLLQERLWALLSDPKVTKKYQIIVATHSAFALGLKDSHLIEMNPGYHDECLAAFKRKFS